MLHVWITDPDHRLSHESLLRGQTVLGDPDERLRVDVVQKATTEALNLYISRLETE